jgi:hypothetical protein
MVTTRSRSDSAAAPPSPSPNAKKARGRPRKTPLSNGELGAADLSIGKDEIEESKSVEKVTNAVDFDQKDHTNDKSSGNKDRALLMRQKKEQTQLLRRKATGMGVAIQATPGMQEAEPTNRKIVFDDDSIERHDDREVDDAKTEPTKETPEIQKENDDDDDDLVEEVVGSSRAKDAIRFEAEQIRVAQIAALKQKKKRKAFKNLVTTTGDTDPDFDNHFFQQLEEEQLQNKKRKKSKSRDMDDATTQRPKHTAFVVHENETIEDHVVEHPHNIQVVVLSHDERITNEPVSDMMQLYSRCGFIDPSTAPATASNKRSSKKRHNAKTVANEATWTRSNRMNHILSVPSRVRRQGKPAMHFSSKSKG